ncbi:MATE family efflux transporter [Mergibacter septicus]|uniref:MATE family efflux transporter n=1 Tax=Mergibacter septicus TaxID=221402 RepID=UPI00117936A2|nr:MATE family efflux transporter [Mergibacter septicus]AWX13422.1 MATE family efflux transporter [Mergibacter septicus]
MQNWQLYKIQIKQLIKLAYPILIAQIVQSLMGVIDVIMAGRVSAKDMAAISIGTSIYFPLILFGQGLLLALPPTISYLNGAGKRAEIAHQVRQGLWIAILISIPLFLIIYHSHFIIDLMKMDQTLATISADYLKFMAFGIFPYLIAITFRGLNDGIAKTKPAMVIAAISLILNIPLNYIFIYGKFGIPAFGGVGCGIATMLIYWFQASLLILYCYKTPNQKDLKVFQPIIEKPAPQTLLKLSRLGLPIALAICSEVILFTIVSLLLSPLGAEVVASHQIALNTSSSIYIIPLSIGMATTILIGQSLGENNLLKARQFTFSALSLGLLITLITAILTFFLREKIASIFVDDFNVITMAASLLLFAALYQVFDTTQVIIGGVLRGYKETKPVLWISVLGYLSFGLPVGYLLALTDLITTPLAAKGFWIGFVLCLILVSILLSIRLYRLQHLPDKEILLRLQKRQ